MKRQKQAPQRCTLYSYCSQWPFSYRNNLSSLYNHSFKMLTHVNTTIIATHLSSLFLLLIESSHRYAKPLWWPEQPAFFDKSINKTHCYEDSFFQINKCGDVFLCLGNNFLQQPLGTIVGRTGACPVITGPSHRDRQAHTNKFLLIGFTSDLYLPDWCVFVLRGSLSPSLA